MRDITEPTMARRIRNTKSSDMPGKVSYKKTLVSAKDTDLQGLAIRRGCVRP